MGTASMAWFDSIALDDMMSELQGNQDNATTDLSLPFKNLPRVMNRAHHPIFETIGI